jgi:hypothetical protein
MIPSRMSFAWRLALVLSLGTVLLAFSFSSTVWALPGQNSLRQTVPTRKPGSTGAMTPVPSTMLRATVPPSPSATPVPSASSADGRRTALLAAAGGLLLVGIGAYVILQRRGSSSPH